MTEPKKADPPAVPREAYLYPHTHGNIGSVVRDKCPACATEKAVAYMQAKVDAGDEAIKLVLKDWQTSERALEAAQESRTKLAEAIKRNNILPDGTVCICERSLGDGDAHSIQCQQITAALADETNTATGCVT